MELPRLILNVHGAVESVPFDLSNGASKSAQLLRRLANDKQLESIQDTNVRNWNQFSELHRKWSLSVLSHKLFMEYNNTNINYDNGNNSDDDYDYDSEYDELDLFDNIEYQQLLNLFPNANTQLKKSLLSQKQIDLLPTCKYYDYYHDLNLHSNEKNEFNFKLKELIYEESNNHLTKCIFCLTNFNNDDTIKQLPCKHIFHRNEIDTWLTISNLCPICRFPLCK